MNEVINESDKNNFYYEKSNTRKLKKKKRKIGVPHFPNFGTFSTLISQPSRNYVVIGHAASGRGYDIDAEYQAGQYLNYNGQSLSIPDDILK